MFYIVLVRLFLTIFAVVMFFVTFWLQMVVFAFLRNVTSQFKNFENLKFPEYSDPLLQQFPTIKASNSTFVLCRKIALCQSGGMAQVLNIKIKKLGG